MLGWGISAPRCWGRSGSTSTTSVSSCPGGRGQLRITAHLLRLRHGFHLGLALSFLGRKTTGAALALVPVRGGDSGAWIARFTRHSPAPCVPPHMRPDWRSTAHLWRPSAHESPLVPQRCREAFAPHLERHHRMPCRRERDNRRQATAGWLQCSLALCSLQHLRWYLVPPVVLKKSSEPTWCSESHCTAVAWCCPAPLPASCPANCPRPAPSGQRG